MSSLLTPARKYGAALAAVMLLALLLRIFPLVYSHGWDETVFLQNALVLVDGRDNYDEFYYRPPLISFAYAIGFQIWNHLYAAHFVQGLLATLPVVGAYLFASALAGRRVGLMAATLFALLPYIVKVSHQLQTDAPAIGLMLISMWLFERRGRLVLVLSGSIFAAAVLMRFNSFALAAYFLLIAALLPRRIRDLVPFGIGAAVTVAPYLLWAQLRFGNFLFPFKHARDIVTKWTRHDPVSMYSGGIFEIFPAIVLVGLLVAVIFAARRLIPATRASGAGVHTMSTRLDQSIRYQLALLCWGMLFFIHMATIPHKEVRYLLPLAIPVIVLSAIGFEALYLALERRYKSLAFGLAIGLAGLVGWTVLPSFGKLGGPWVIAEKDQNVRIAEFIRQDAKPGDTLYAATWFPVLAFYSGLKTVSTLPIQESFNADWRKLMAMPGYFVWYRMDSDFEDHSRFDVLMPNRAFLEAQGSFRKVREFESAVVYRYSAGTPVVEP